VCRAETRQVQVTACSAGTDLKSKMFYVFSFSNVSIFKIYFYYKYGTTADTGMQKNAAFVMEIHVEKDMCSRNIRHIKPNLQCALCSCFLLLSLPSCLFVHSFIDIMNYVSCHVFLASSGVRQLLSRATETKTVCKEAKTRNGKQRAHCR